MADPHALGDDDIQLQSPQDDVQTSGEDTVTEDMTDKPADDYQIPEKELREELNNRIVDDEDAVAGQNSGERFDPDDALNEQQDQGEDGSNEIGR